MFKNMGKEEIFFVILAYCLVLLTFMAAMTVTVITIILIGTLMTGVM